MYSGKTLFAQVMGFLPWTTFGRIVVTTATAPCVRCDAPSTTSRWPLRSFSGRESLRDIEACLAARSAKLSPAAVSAQGSRPQAGQGTGARRGAATVGSVVVPAATLDLTAPDDGVPARTAHPGVRPRGLEPGPAQTLGAARHRLHHLAQELQRRGLATGMRSAPLRYRSMVPPAPVPPPRGPGLREIARVDGSSEGLEDSAP